MQPSEELKAACKPGDRTLHPIIPKVQALENNLRNCRKKNGLLIHYLAKLEDYVNIAPQKIKDMLPKEIWAEIEAHWPGSGMIEFHYLSFGDQALAAPLQWWIGNGEIWMMCPNGHISALDHEIATDGTVAPPVICPHESCNFHESIRLRGWK